MEACKRKVPYDSEFEAERAAAISEYRWGEDMKTYPCGRHWHIAHKKKIERNKHPSRNWCDICEISIRPWDYESHKLSKRHRKSVVKKRKELV